LVICSMTVATLLVVLVHFGPAQAGEVTIPVTNLPANFSGAAGAYRIETRAAPTTVHVEDPITLTVKIISLTPGPWPYPPQRDKLRILPAELDTIFFIEPLPEFDRFVAAEKAWEFSWRLMPKHERANKIPALEFAYYHSDGATDFKVAEGGKSIALEVQPRSELLLTAPAATRARFQQVVAEPHLLRKSPSREAQAVTLLAGLALPPLLCVAAYWAWWWLFPDAAERLRRSRSRALKIALSRFRKLGPSVSSFHVRRVLGDYLRLRLALPPGETTPQEAKKALLTRGLGSDWAGKAEAMLQECDAALFAPSSPAGVNDLKADATQLMRSLETELCSPKSR
jgi:hypothetical protein